MCIFLVRSIRTTLLCSQTKEKRSKCFHTKHKTNKIQLESCDRLFLVRLFLFIACLVGRLSFPREIELLHGFAIQQIKLFKRNESRFLHWIYLNELELCSTCGSFFLLRLEESQYFQHISSDLCYITILFAHLYMMEWLWKCPFWNFSIRWEDLNCMK